METIVITYIAYLLISISLTVWVARTLFKNGQPFLDDAFGGDERVAKSVNHLLVVGFYLINLGYITLNLKLGTEVFGAQDAIEELSVQIGLVLLVLGGMHFFNLYLFNRIRKRRNHTSATPPVFPTTHLRTLSGDDCDNDRCDTGGGITPTRA